MVLARATGTDSESGWAAVPVQAHDGGVVTELAPGRAHDGVAERVDDLAGVEVAAAAQRVGDVHFGRVAFQHAVGDEDDAVTRRYRELLHPERPARTDAEREVDVQLDLLDAPVAQPQREWMASIDDLR